MHGYLITSGRADFIPRSLHLEATNRMLDETSFPASLRYSPLLRDIRRHQWRLYKNQKWLSFSGEKRQLKELSF